MKSHFSQYYRISTNDLLGKFEDCVFVFDACALLDIFRLKQDLVDDIFKVIDHYKYQIRIPYHAASECFKDINVVLTKQIDNINASKKSFDDFSQTFQAQRNYPYITDEASKLLANLKKQIEKDFSSQTKYIEDQLIYGSHQNKLFNLLEGKVLKPFSPEEISAIEKEGELRYSEKIPPGWKDASKGDNRYGDLINWKEILRFAKESGKSIIYVSNDVKEDWVANVKGKKIGVLPQLLKEFYTTVGNSDQLFHVYTLDRFLAFINDHDKDVISEEAVQDIQVSIEKPQTPLSMFEYIQKMNKDFKTPEYIAKLQEFQDAYKKISKLNGSFLYDDYMSQKDSVDDTERESQKLIQNLDNEDLSKNKQGMADQEKAIEGQANLAISSKAIVEKTNPNRIGEVDKIDSNS